jgi:hypothetical protein
MMTVLFLRELPRLEEHRLRHADLADVVQLGAQRDRVHQGLVHTERAGDTHGVARDPHRMTARVGVLRFQRFDQRVQPLEHQLFDAARLRGHTLFQVLVILLVLEDQAALFDRLRHTGAHLVEMKRLGHVVEGAQLQARDRGLYFRDRGDHDDGGARVPLHDLFQEGDTVHLGHAQIGNHEG